VPLGGLLTHPLASSSFTVVIVVVEINVHH